MVLICLVLVPAHVNETTERRRLGGTVSIVFIGALVLSINFAPGEGLGHIGSGARGDSGRGYRVLPATATCGHPVVLDLHMKLRAADLLGRGGGRWSCSRSPWVRCSSASSQERPRLLDAGSRCGHHSGCAGDGDRCAALGDQRSGTRRVTASPAACSSLGVVRRAVPVTKAPVVLAGRAGLRTGRHRAMAC